MSKRVKMSNVTETDFMSVGQTYDVLVLPKLHEQPYAEPPVSQLSPCPSFCACFPCGGYLVNISKNVSRTMYLL